MDWRNDKFRVGESVVWADGYGDLAGGRGKYGDGPFRITKVIDRAFEPGDESYQSNWSSMGHTQHVYINVDRAPMFSGAFFAKAEEPS